MDALINCKLSWRSEVPEAQYVLEEANLVFEHPQWLTMKHWNPESSPSQHIAFKYIY